MCVSYLNSALHPEMHVCVVHSVKHGYVCVLCTRDQAAVHTGVCMSVILLHPPTDDYLCCACMHVYVC